MTDLDKLKHSVHGAIWYYKKIGFIKNQPCEICGKEKTDAHHEDYSKIFDIRWLCRKHHFDRHRELDSNYLKWQK